MLTAHASAEQSIPWSPCRDDLPRMQPDLSVGRGGPPAQPLQPAGLPPAQRVHLRLHRAVLDHDQGQWTASLVSLVAAIGLVASVCNGGRGGSFAAVATAFFVFVFVVDIFVTVATALVILMQLLLLSFLWLSQTKQNICGSPGIHSCTTTAPVP